jgi:hypothetical protein
MHRKRLSRMPDFIKSTPVELRHKFAMQRLRFYADRETTINVDKETALLSIAARRNRYFLNASLTFSPASLMLDLA